MRLWTPLRIDPAGTDFGGFNFSAIARLREGVTPQDAQADLNALVLPREARLRAVSRCGPRLPTTT